MSPEIRSDPNCAFCSIVRGESPARIVCSDERWLAFLPLQPATHGHTLVVPRSHVRDFWIAPPEMVADLAKAALRVGLAVSAAFSPEGLNLLTSAGRVAEQTVDHLHLHVLPRWHNDPVDPIWPPQRTYSPSELDRTAERLRRECANGYGA